MHFIQWNNSLADYYINLFPIYLLDKELFYFVSGCLEGSVFEIPQAQCCIGIQNHESKNGWSEFLKAMGLFFPK